jgi:manganese transport protein
MQRTGGRLPGVIAAVLLVPLLHGVRPIPAILLAQALNGVVLPFAAVFLLLVVNDRGLMGERGLNGPLSNALMSATVAVTLLLGVAGVLRAGATGFGIGDPDERLVLVAAGVIAAVLLVPLLHGVRRGRSAPARAPAG